MPHSVVNKLEALLTDDARVVIYDRHVFIVQATGSTGVRYNGGTKVKKKKFYMSRLKDDMFVY